jgi:putative aldouronate transport system permease protein
MYGVIIAFKDYNAVGGVMGSPWAGLKHFRSFVTAYEFGRILRNTVTLSLGQLIFGFPVPILLALIVNEIRAKKYRMVVQTITYAPHFISIVVLCGMLVVFLSPSSGIVNQAIMRMGFEPIQFLAKPDLFKPIYIGSGIWQNAGWSSIIYIATLTSVDTQLYDAAYVDGCTRLQKIRHIDIPVLIPTVTILLILQCGQIMNIGFEKVLLLQNPLNMSSSDIIQTYVYRKGLINAQYSFSTAVELFNNIINMALLVSVNKISARISESSLW